MLSMEWADRTPPPNRGRKKFDTCLFLPAGEGRQGEGGLRTKGYFKFSLSQGEGNKGEGGSKNNCRR